MRDVGKCANCAAPMALPDDLYAAAKHSERIVFYCAYGHPQHFPQGASEADKLRQERDRLAQRIAEKDDRIKYEREQREAAERRVSAARGQVTKIKNRVGHGVCPCCTRTFGNLQRHMASQHPDYTKPELEAAE